MRYDVYMAEWYSNSINLKQHQTSRSTIYISIIAQFIYIYIYIYICIILYHVAYIISVNTKNKFSPAQLGLWNHCITLVTNWGTFGHKSCRVTNWSILWSQIVPQSQIEASHKSCRHTIILATTLEGAGHLLIRNREPSVAYSDEELRNVVGLVTIIYDIIAILCATSRYEGQRKAITFHGNCGMWLLVPALHTCFCL